MTLNPAVLIAAVLATVVAVPAQAEMAGASALGRESFGVASWYGPGLKGRRTANGEKFNPKGLTAAHPTLPFGTLVEVSRPDRKKSVVVVITDRGPFTGRAIDLSQAAARRLQMTYMGAVPVRMQVVGKTE